MLKLHSLSFSLLIGWHLTSFSFVLLSEQLSWSRNVLTDESESVEQQTVKNCKPNKQFNKMNNVKRENKKRNSFLRNKTKTKTKWFMPIVSLFVWFLFPLLAFNFVLLSLCFCNDRKETIQSCISSQNIVISATRTNIWEVWWFVDKKKQGDDVLWQEKKVFVVIGLPLQFLTIKSQRKWFSEVSEAVLLPNIFWFKLRTWWNTSWNSCKPCIYLAHQHILSNKKWDRIDTVFTWGSCVKAKENGFSTQ